MSIELLVETPGPEPRRLVPIIPRDLFDSHWMPAAERLGLAWVPMMRTGFLIVPEELGHIREELLYLHADIFSSASRANDRDAQLTAADAVLRLLAELEASTQEPGWSSYIG